MSGSVTSPTAFNAYTNYTINNMNLNGVMRRLSTGVKNTVDDGAGVAISERMRSQANSTAKARSNVDNAVSYLQTADTWLQNIGDMLGRMHELAVDANDATKTQTDRTNINTEFKGLQAEINRIATSAAKFNGGGILSTGSGGATQVGSDSGQTITMSTANLAVGAMTIGGGASTGTTWGEIVSANATEVSTTAGATSAISNLSGAINFIAMTRADIGAQQERFEKTRTGLLSYEDQIRTAESKIRTIDTAKESSDMMKYQILSQIGTAMLAQANQLPSSAVQLVG